MSEKRLVPKRRFKGFEGEWDVKKFKEIANYRHGTAHEKYVSEDGKYILVNSRFISTGGAIKKYTNIQNEPLYKNEIAFVLSDIPNGRALARTYLINKNGTFTLNQRILGIKPNDYTESYFLKELMNRHEYFLSFDDGVNQTNLSNKAIDEFKVCLPNYKEQQKIGRFFKLLDDRIANQEKKVAKVKALKSAYLSEMFPQEGETIPKRRFKGFELEWESQKISDVFKVTRGDVLSTTKISKVKSKANPYPVYSSQTQYNGLLGYYSEYLFDTAITWTTDGANAGTVNYREGKFYSTNVNGVLLSDVGYACQAVAESLNLVAWKYVSKVGNPKLMNNVMSEIEILLPTDLNELKLISKFFKNLDDQIEMEEKKLAKLKAMKEAYLEEMFV